MAGRTYRDGNAPRYRAPHEYESDATQFLRDVIAKNPRIEEEQRAGRNMFWDRQLDDDEQRRYQQVSVKQKPYVYDPELKPQFDQRPKARHTVSEAKWH